MKKSISIILSIVLVLAIIFLAVFSIVSVISVRNNRVPFLFGFASVQLVSGSMSPKYEAGDVLLIKKVSPDEIKNGDVISFFSSDPTLKGNMNTHRVVDVTNENGIYKFTTKGDANPKNDRYPVYETELIGKVVLENVLFSKLFTILRSKLGFFGVIMLPILAVLFISIRGFVIAIKNERKIEISEGEVNIETLQDEK